MRNELIRMSDPFFPYSKACLIHYFYNSKSWHKSQKRITELDYTLEKYKKKEKNYANKLDIYQFF